MLVVQRPGLPVREDGEETGLPLPNHDPTDEIERISKEVSPLVGKRSGKSKSAKTVKVHETAPLPSPTTHARVPLALDDDILVEMNARLFAYGMYSAGVKAVEQVRQDFAHQGANDPDILYDKKSNKFYRRGHAIEKPDQPASIDEVIAAHGYDDDNEENGDE